MNPQAHPIEFAQLSNNELILRFEKLVRTERKITHLVLLHINEIESRKLYAELGFDGVYTYLTRGLGYSEASAHRRVQSARLLKQIPNVAAKIEGGSLNLTQLAQVQKCLKDSERKGKNVSVEKTEQLLEKLENKNSFDTQKTLAVEMNMPVQVFDKVTPQQDESVRIQITLTKEEFEDLERAKSLLSHVCPDGNLSNVIATLARKFNSSKLVGRKPIEKSIGIVETKMYGSVGANAGVNTNSQAHANIKNKMKTSKNGNIKVSSNSTQSASATQAKGGRSNRKYISVYTKRRLFERADHCCEYSDSKTKVRCGSKYKLEIDHRHPVALGGKDEFDNLRVLCQAHNLMAARQMGLISSNVKLLP